MPKRRSGKFPPIGKKIRGILFLLRRAEWPILALSFLPATAKMLASIIDHAISIILGVVLTLLGYRVIGPKKGGNPKYDSFYDKWTRHLRWMGPLVILIFVGQLAFALLARNGSKTDNSLKAELRASVEKSMSSDGRLAADDFLFDSEEGFTILVPAGCTYSSPSKQIGLVAVCKSGDDTTSAILVSIEYSALGSEAFIDQLKQTLLANKRKTHEFSELKSLIHEDTVLQVLVDRVVRDDGVVIKSTSLVASKNGKYFVVTIGANENSYGDHANEIDRVIASFQIR